MAPLAMSRLLAVAAAVASVGAEYDAEAAAAATQEALALAENDECANEEAGCALNALQMRRRSRDAETEALWQQVRGESQDWSPDEDFPSDRSFFVDLEKVLNDHPVDISRITDDSELLESDMAETESEGGVVSRNATKDGLMLTQESMLPEATCKYYGCVGYVKIHKCQCNMGCDKYGNCCPDYKHRCYRYGGGKIVVEEAWVGLVNGQADEKFPRLLCKIVLHYTKGHVCHNGIVFRGSVAGRHGMFFLEYGNSGFEDLFTGKKKWGLQVSWLGERFMHKKLLVRKLSGPDFSKRLSWAVEYMRNEPYAISFPAISRLLHRTNDKGFSKHLMCSDSVAQLLVHMGCLKNNKAAWNAQPKDFSSRAKHQTLTWTCGIGPDYWIDTKHYK